MGKKYTFTDMRWARIDLKDNLISIFLNATNNTIDSEGICVIQNDNVGLQIRSLINIKALSDDDLRTLIEEAIISTSNDLVRNLYTQESYDINDFMNIVVKKLNDSVEGLGRIYFRVSGHDSDDKPYGMICGASIEDIVLDDTIMDRIYNKLK